MKTKSCKDENSCKERKDCFDRITNYDKSLMGDINLRLIGLEVIGQMEIYFLLKHLCGNLCKIWEATFSILIRFYILYGSHHKKHTVKIYSNNDFLLAKLTNNLPRKNSFRLVFSWPMLHLSRHSNHGSCWSNIRNKI